MRSPAGWMLAMLAGCGVALGGAITAQGPASSRLPAQADEIANYQISVTLDPDTKQITGRQRLTWRNPSSDTVSDLWFHLYLNAFQNTKTTFFRESGGHLRQDEMPVDGWGWIDVTSIALADGTDLKSALTFQSPDDGNRDDRTVARLALPRPVAPGASIVVDIQFTAQLPKIFARTGYVRDYFLVAQWFPKIAVYEPAGTRGRAAGGWNCHQFHALTEFYADFGHYRVDVTLPARFTVGATGRRLERRVNRNGTVTHVYEQGNVHDFAWTAAPDFIEVSEPFVASREVTSDDYARAARLLDRSLDEVKLEDVDVTLLMQRAHMPQLDRHVRAMKLALKEFGLRYGRYPHGTLTLVDPPYGAGGSDGMEYPTFVTVGTSAWLNRWPLAGVRFPEIGVVHEIGHQWFQGMLASNEFEEPWLDEGINSYATGRTLEVGYGREATLIDVLGWHGSERDYIRTPYTPDAKFHAIRQLPWTYTRDNAYAVNSYIRPELVLRTLESIVGPQTMARIMRTYVERWRYRHPSTEDFYAVANDVSGRDLRPFLSQVIDHGQVLDYEVDEITSDLAIPPSGYLDGPRGRTFVSQADAETQRDANPHPPYDTRIVLRRRGEAIAPVAIAIKFEGKPVERVTWDGQARTHVLRYTRPERLEWVDIDPDRGIELDVDWLSNTRRLDPDRRSAARLTSRWMFVLQQALMLLGL